MPPPSPAPDSKRLRAGCRLARLCGTIWREPGAKRGDFLLQTATIGARSERVDTEKSITYPLRLPLPRLGRVWAHGSAFTLAALGRRKAVHLARNRKMLWGGRRGMATSSLHFLDGVPRCPSQTT